MSRRRSSFDAITPGQKDYTSALTRVASTNPDAFYFTGYYAEAAILVKEYKDLVYPELTVHAFYVKYLLPIYFDVQSMERPGT